MDLSYILMILHVIFWLIAAFEILNSGKSLGQKVLWLLVIFLLPLIDVVWAVIRRTKAGRRPWQPDAGHLHHRMLAFGHGHRRAVLLLWGWAAAISLGSVAFVFFDARIATGIFVIMLGTAAALTLWLPRAVVGGRRPQPDAPSITPPGSQP